MADLVRNPDSSNLLYVDAAKFPNELQGSSIDINYDGTFNITWKNYTGAFFPPFETEITNGTYYIGIGSEHREDIDTINIMYSDGTSSGIYPHYQRGTQSHNMNYYQTIFPSNLSLRYLIIAPYNPNTNISNVKISITTSNNIAWESAYKVVEKYTITFHDPSGTNPDVSHTVEQESPTPTPPSWTRSGYELVGWSPEIAEAVTGDATYNALWATEGLDELPLTLSQLRQWGDANGYSTGTNIANPETHTVTLRQAAMLFGFEGDASMAGVGNCVVTVGQFKMLSEAKPPINNVVLYEGTASWSGDYYDITGPMNDPTEFSGFTVEFSSGMTVEFGQAEQSGSSPQWLAYDDAGEYVLTIVGTSGNFMFAAGGMYVPTPSTVYKLIGHK